ncbi:MAG: glycerol-3-phosphate dehydrogenase [Candidatus Margulisiibacteriota bacterium]|nr:MAG: glycerol-3-phosphate dehydrogenase [Candidatus Margulisiibacteriota bacterium]HCY36225.1 glycerol-3-phosphate dehydrogenase [Candidatus Margulisiibacteriota bacterium]
MTIVQPSQKKISVIGSGAWGTTLAIIASDNSHKVKLWTHDKTLKQQMTVSRKNNLLPGIELPNSITFHSEFSDDFLDSDIIIIVVASKFFRNTCKNIVSKIKQSTVVISATKGLEQNTAKTPYDILCEELPAYLHDNIGILSGPNIALEIAQKKPATSVIASKSIKTAEAAQQALSNKYFRVYTNEDIIGIELGGILKNIIAIAAGIADGLELGNNSKSSLMIRGIYEITKLAKTLGAKPSTMLGLAGMGDLITTCTSPLSRNYQVGFQLAHGKTIDEIVSSIGSIAEGIKTCEIIYGVSKQHKVELPIIEQVYNVLFKNLSPMQAINNLMERKLKLEYEETSYE